MTTRHASIIVCPGQDGTDSALPGTLHDAEFFKNFLLSDIGGAWNENEIKTLINPTARDVAVATYQQRQADFGLTLYSGHGGVKNDELLLDLADGNCKAAGLYTGKKQLLIIDCCRAIIEERLYESIAKSTYAMEKRSSVRQVARRLYDQRIEQMPDGYIALYAADYRELSYMTEHGSYYIMSLLRAAEALQGSVNNSVISAAQAHRKAKEIMTKYKTKQNPQLEGMKTQIYPPFAVDLG